MEEVAISERKRVSLCLPAFLIKFKKQGTLKKIRFLVLTLKCEPGAVMLRNEQLQQCKHSGVMSQA